MSTDVETLLARGRALDRIQAGADLYVWYEREDGEAEVNSVVPDQIEALTHGQIAATSPWLDQGRLRVLCVPKASMSLARIASLLPDEIRISRPQGGVYRGHAGEEPEVPTDTLVYRLYAIAPDPDGMISYEQAGG